MQKQNGNYEQYNRNDYGYYERSGNNNNYAMYNDGGNNYTNKMMMDNIDGRAAHMSNPGLPMR